MIIDCFLFFDEFDLLEIRLRELADVVDAHFLLESSLTFSGKTKPRYFREHDTDRFDEWRDRIWVVSPRVPEALLGNPWAIEAYHRDALMDYMTPKGCEDIVILSDADEIPCADWVRRLPDLLQSHDVVGGDQRLYWYWLNCRREDDWVAGTRATLSGRIKESHPGESLRKAKSYNAGWSGWHFSYMGDVQKKLAAFSHTELNRPPFNDPEHIRTCKDTCTDIFGAQTRHGSMGVTDDLSLLPKCVRDNPSAFNHLIKHGPS